MPSLKGGSNLKYNLRPIFSMHERRGRTGISKLVIPVALIVILVAAGAYFFLARGSITSTSTSSSFTGALPTIPVNTTVDQFIQDFNNRNVDGLVTFYTPNAVLVWSGQVGGLKGLYSPLSNIRLIYATTVGKSVKLDANVSNYAQKTISPTIANASYVLSMVENSTEAGIVHATIDVTQEWTWGSSGWQISKENWAYASFDSSFIDAGIPAATTFPQWGYELKGGNPNLVSEKSFEWHAGPFVAAAVYAFLFGVVAFMALRLRPWDRTPRAVGKGRE
ncbi:MAG: hypothetical protein OK454_05650 [Thaumarchaeota archaeon]|nr:hypothetical protein [Nitrososphaerota archaeon]